MINRPRVAVLPKDEKEREALEHALERAGVRTGNAYLRAPDGIEIDVRIPDDMSWETVERSFAGQVAFRENRHFNPERNPHIPVKSEFLDDGRLRVRITDMRPYRKMSEDGGPGLASAYVGEEVLNDTGLSFFRDEDTGRCYMAPMAEQTDDAYIRYGTFYPVDPEAWEDLNRGTAIESDEPVEIPRDNCFRSAKKRRPQIWHEVTENGDLQIKCNDLMRDELRKQIDEDGGVNEAEAVDVFRAAGVEPVDPSVIPGSMTDAWLLGEEEPAPIDTYEDLHEGEEELWPESGWTLEEGEASLHPAYMLAGRVWKYEDTALKDPIEELAEHGEIGLRFGADFGRGTLAPPVNSKEFSEIGMRAYENLIPGSDEREPGGPKM